MGELGRFIKSNNILMRMTSLILSVAVLVSALVYFDSESMQSVSAEGDLTRPYMEYIVQRLIDGIQDEFNVLEIVPYKGQGEFRYYASDDEVKDGLETNQTLLASLYAQTGKNTTTQANQWYDMHSPFSNFGYQIMYNTDTSKYEVKAPDTFTTNVVPQYDDLISEVINVNTVEANKLTEADIAKADMIIISTGTHDNNSINAYRAFTGDTSQVVYKKDGTPIADDGVISYNTFEKILASELPEEDDDVIPDEPVITTGRVYFKNSENYANVYAYYWSSENGRMIDWPGKKMTFVAGEEDIYYVEITSDVEKIIFNDGSSRQTVEQNFVGFEKIYVGGEWKDYPLVEDTTEESTEPESESSSEEETTTSDSTESSSTESGSEGSSEEITTEITTETTTEATTETTTEATTETTTEATTETTEPETSGPEVEEPEITEPDDEYAYITRDISWNMCEKLLDYVINGKDMLMPDGTTLTNVKTPVIIDNGRVSQLNKDSNMYKFMLIYRTCAADRWNVLKESLSTKDASGHRYKNTDGATTVAIDMDGTGFKADSLISWVDGSDNTIKTFFAGKEGAASLSAYNEDNPSSADYLTNDYWVYNGSSYLIPKNVTGDINTTDVNGSNVSFTDRIGSEKKATSVLRYLLGAKDSQTYSFTDKVRVLEIQPCNCYDYKSLDKIKELGRKLLRKDYNSWTDGGPNDYRRYISIDYVTPNALNSMTVDIASEYDLVIIGDNIGSGSDKNRLTQQDGKTIFNDRNLNGYIYLAFGDLQKVGTAALGLLPDEYIELNSSDANSYKSRLVKIEASKKHLWTSYIYNTFIGTGGTQYYILRDMYSYYRSQRKAGSTVDNEKFYLDHYLGNTRMPDNDITDITKEKLINFVKTGNPIVVEDCVYDADPTKIYPTSDMYDFAKNILGKTEGGKRVYTNVLRQDALGTSVAYLGTKAPRITFLTGDVKVITRTGVNTYSESIQTLPLKPVEPTYAGGVGGVVTTFNDDNLYYKFNITGQVGKTYKIKLYIDMDNDGVYREINLDDVAEGESIDDNELYVADEITLSRRTVTYEIRSALSDKFIGMLPWKLEVIELDDAGNETVFKVQEKGYSAIKTDAEKVVNVLQIVPYHNSYLDLDYPSFTNLLAEVKSAVGYDTHLTIMTAEGTGGDSFVQQYVGNPYRRDIEGQGFGSERDKLKNYDMIVIGFADSYNSKDIDNTNGAMDNLIDFMDNGGSVLFTHDTMAWRSSANYYAGYANSRGELVQTGNDNTKLMSAQNNSYEVKADGTTAGNSQVRYGQKPFNLTLNLRNRVGMDKYGVTLTPEERVAQGKEIPMYAEGYEKPNYMEPSELEVREIQGYNNWNICRMNFCFKQKSNYNAEGKNFTAIRQFADGTYYGSSNDNNNGKSSVMFTTDRVVQINEGPITMYPYNIGTELPIQTTHGQYFELDMEDEDIVVWYALDGGTSNVSKYYDKTYKDGGNNYYIYSKNNITYSGAGHQSYDKNNPTLELKLFVNTIMAAISGGNSAPEIDIINGGEVATNKYVVYVNSAETASSYEIDFCATDTDLVTYEKANKNIDMVSELKRAEIYWKKLDGTTKLIKSSDYKNYKDGANHIGPLKNGIVQEILLGETNLTAEELAEIEFEVEDPAGRGATFIIEVEDGKDGISKVEVDLRVRDLFEMD